MHITDSTLTSCIPWDDILQPDLIAEAGEMPAILNWDGKHPLARTWSFWYFDPEIKGENLGSADSGWEQSIVKIGTFSTIEDFWSYIRYIKPISMMKTRCDICLFKGGIQPKWEDPANRSGARWALNFDKNTPTTMVDTHWLNLMMDLIGENLGEFGEIVTGAIVNKRERNNRVGVWINTTDLRDPRVDGLGRKIKENLEIPPGFEIQLQSHELLAKYPGGKSIIHKI
ncbi:eukaryotic translation initiation factor [Nesidiocoris tenuis]|uniref:Eukaryotic translation initiation factor n=1 Tax=Nesidiocoris tenuis TaxID=355587 RepID=A0ABN7BD50_9HEMI|nr:eukaryotic translation initiation factor [Nesidiocoris tenuis]